jgi:hypothetical protein
MTMTAAKTTTKKAAAPKPVPTVDISPEELEEKTWGPFKEVHTVNMPFGEYDVPPGEIMHFEYRTVWDFKLQKEVTRPMPFYEKVYIDDPRLLPGNTKKTLAAKEA